MAKRTTDEWQALLDGVAEGPWEARQDGRDPVWMIGRLGDNPARIVGDGYGEGNARLLAAAPESVAEVVRLRRAFEEFIGELNDDLAHEGIEDYGDIDDAWPSMQEYGELTVKLAHRNILTHILEGHNDGGIGK